jgi:hypothetical protein
MQLPSDAIILETLENLILEELDEIIDVTSDVQADTVA